jgi:integrase
LSQWAKAHDATPTVAEEAGVRCTCQPSYRAFVYDRTARPRNTDGTPKLDKDGKAIRGEIVRKTFSGKGALAQAKRWRANAHSDVIRGRHVPPSRRTFEEVAAGWLAGAKADPPTTLTRSGLPFKPSVLRGYESDLRRNVYPPLGDVRLSDIRRGDVQALVDSLIGAGHSPSKVRNAIMPLRAIMRWAVERDMLEHNPTAHIKLPNGLGKRDRAEAPASFEEIVAPLDADDHDVFASAFYAGLRLGELQALDWEHVDLDQNPSTIRVERSWDEQAGFVRPKSRAGVRTVPIPALLARRFRERLLRSGRRSGLLFGRAEGDKPFWDSTLYKSARASWQIANEERAEQTQPALPTILLHECRHSYRTWLRSADVSRELRDEFLGHSDPSIGGRYEHTSDADRKDAVSRMDAYLARELSVEAVRKK